jgi:hypothetical protein
MSGVITRHIPSAARAGTWNVIDLPPPVGISARVSFPEAILKIISSWSGLNEEKPHVFFKISL